MASSFVNLLGRPGDLLEQISPQAGHLMVQGVESSRQIVVGVGDTGESENALLEAFDGAPGDVRFAEVGERLGEEIELFLHGRGRFGDRFDEHGEILRRQEIRVRAAQAEMGFDEFDFAQGVHLADAGRLVEKIGEIKEIERPGEGTLGTRGALGHEGKTSGLPAEAAHDEARIAEGHSSDNKAPDGSRFAHGIGFSAMNDRKGIRI